MHITILGGTGRIGRLIVDQALAAGDELTLLVRDPQKVAPLADQVRLVPGWALVLLHVGPIELVLDHSARIAKHGCGGLGA